MIHVTCRLTAKNRDQLRNPTLGNRVWATFTFFTVGVIRGRRKFRPKNKTANFGSAFFSCALSTLAILVPHFQTRVHFHLVIFSVSHNPIHSVVGTECNHCILTTLQKQPASIRRQITAFLAENITYRNEVQILR